jgi:hypothetical protein
MISGRDEVMLEAQDRDLQLLHKPFRSRDLADALDRAFASGLSGRRGEGAQS